MKFRQLEDLPIDEDELTPSEREQLDRALEELPEMRAEYSAWETIETSFRDAPLAEPAPGFSDRWRHRAVHYRHRRMYRQVKLVLGTLLAGSFVVLMMLGLYLLDSPAGTVSAWMSFAIRAAQTLDAGVRILSVLDGGLPIFLGGLVVSAALAWLSLLWIAAIYRFTSTRVTQGVR